MHHFTLAAIVIVVTTAGKRSYGKVMFLHLSISHSVHRGVSLTEIPLGRDPSHWSETTPPGQRAPQTKIP